MAGFKKWRNIDSSFWDLPSSDFCYNVNPFICGMKKIINLCIALSFMHAGTAQLLNPGFEDLRSDGHPRNWGSITLLSFLDTSKPCKIDSAFYFASKDAHSGEYAMELRNADCNGIHTGSAHIMATDDTTYFGAGVPFSQSPAYLAFWYKFAAVGNDTAAAHIWMYNENTGNTIVDQWMYLPSANSYTPVSAQLNYRLSEIPTRLELEFVTEADRNKAHYGSRFIVDDVEMRNSPLSNKLVSKSGFACYPNPTSNNVHFSTNNSGNSVISITRLDGKLITKMDFTGSYILDCSGYENGIYLYTFTDESGQLYNGKILVQR